MRVLGFPLFLGRQLTYLSSLLSVHKGTVLTLHPDVADGLDTRIKRGYDFFISVLLSMDRLGPRPKDAYVCRGGKGESIDQPIQFVRFGKKRGG